MKASTFLGESVPLYTTVPPKLLVWVHSVDAFEAISNAKNVADRAIAALNKEQELRIEDLHQPITL